MERRHSTGPNSDSRVRLDHHVHLLEPCPGHPAGIQAEGLRALPEGTELCTAHSVTNTGGRDGQGRGDQGKQDLRVLPRGSSRLPHLFPKAKLPARTLPSLKIPEKGPTFCGYSASEECVKMRGSPLF